MERLTEHRRQAQHRAGLADREIVAQKMQRMQKQRAFPIIQLFQRLNRSNCRILMVFVRINIGRRTDDDVGLEGFDNIGQIIDQTAPIRTAVQAFGQRRGIGTAEQIDIRRIQFGRLHIGIGILLHDLQCAVKIAEL